MKKLNIAGKFTRRHSLQDAKNQTDKATARPWIISTCPHETGRLFISTEDGDVIAVLASEGGKAFAAREANAGLIVQAVNEHAALVAVAEAAAKLYAGNAMATRCEWTLAQVIQEHYRLLREPLANLVSVREGKAVQS
jgi:hypothetical protein